MARPVTKWASRVTDPASLLRVVRRAIRTAMTPPPSPVFVSLPMDVLDAPNLEEVIPSSIPDTRVAPDPSRILEAAEMLKGAATPATFVGDGIAASQAQAELARPAELIGAEVWGVDSSEVNLAAVPICYTVVKEFVGATDLDLSTLKRWATGIGAALDPLGGAEEAAGGQQIGRELSNYFPSLMGERCKSPHDGSAQQDSSAANTSCNSPRTAFSRTSCASLP